MSMGNSRSRAPSPLSSKSQAGCQELHFPGPCQQVSAGFSMKGTHTQFEGRRDAEVYFSSFVNDGQMPDGF